MNGYIIIRLAEMEIYIKLVERVKVRGVVMVIFNKQVSILFEKLAVSRSRSFACFIVFRGLFNSFLFKGRI